MPDSVRPPPRTNELPPSTLPPVVLFIGIVANVLAFLSGSVYLLAKSGDRFRGMEPLAQASVLIWIVAVAIGLFFGLPLSIWDIVRGRWVWGSLGCLLALTPWPLGSSVAWTVADLRGLIFD